MMCYNLLHFAYTLSWIVAACVHAHAEPPSFKYSRQANEAAQKRAVHQDTSHDYSREDDGVWHAHGQQANPREHLHHGHSHWDENHHSNDHLSQHSHSHHQVHHHEHKQLRQKKEATLDTTTLWVQAIGATLLISIAPFLILIFIPIAGRTGHEDFLKTLLSFASGGLLGDAFLHLIPHAMTPHEHSDDEIHHGHSHSGHHHHHDNSVGFCVLMGIFAFLIVEKFVRMVKGNHSHGDGGHGHNHSHTMNPSAIGGPAMSSSKNPKVAKGTKKEQKETAAVGDRKKREEAEDSTKLLNAGSASEGSDIRVAAYLNLAADFTHNFTDGLAIGASFLAGNTAGIVSTVTILLHEVPHEIGDFAILVQSGMSKRKAMCMQLVTALGCLSGTIVSLLAGGVGAARWVLPFTAGGFIYIATVSVIPELLENTRFWQSVKEIIALILGVSMMMLLTEFENI